MRRALAALPLLVAAPLAAQAPADSAAAAADSAPPARAYPGQQPPAQPLNLWRASWLADRQPLRVGDILTVVVDESMSARERTTKDAVEDRAQALGLNVRLDPASRIGPNREFGTSSRGSTRESGQAGREGDLSATLTVRVTELDNLGNARIEGTKSVNVDGRKQEVALSGLVRPDDILTGNLVPSSRVAEAEISYKGKKIGVKKGILGSLLSIFWP